MSCFVMKGDHENALEQLLKFQESLGGSSGDSITIRDAYSSGGWPAAIRAVLNSSTGIGPRKSLLTVALLAQIGEEDKAVQILDDMRKRRAIMRITVAREPMLDPLRHDPRFDAILSEMDLK
jgi:hypothetical protein